MGPRRVAATALALLAALALVLAGMASWTTRTALDTPRFVALAGPVIDQQPVRDALAGDVSDQLVRLVDLPAAQPYVRRQVAAVVASPSFRPVWYAALAAAHREVVSVLTGSDQALSDAGGEVRLDLIAVVADALRELPRPAAALLGHPGGFDVPAHATAAALRVLVQRFLGVSLPPGFATIALMPASALEVARQGVGVLDGAAPVLVVGAGALLVLALLVAPRRSRVFAWFGLGTAVFAVGAYLVARAVGSGVADHVASASVRPVASAVEQALFDSLRGPTALLAGAGVAVAVFAWAARAVRAAASRG